VGLAAFYSGAGVIGGIIVGIVAGVAALGAGQFAFAVARSPFIPAAIALLFAVPARSPAIMRSLPLPTSECRHKDGARRLPLSAGFSWAARPGDG